MSKTDAAAWPRYNMAQMELATDIVFKRSVLLKAVFRHACELGVLVGGVERAADDAEKVAWFPLDRPPPRHALARARLARA